MSEIFCSQVSRVGKTKRGNCENIAPSFKHSKLIVSLAIVALASTLIVAGGCQGVSSAGNTPKNVPPSPSYPVPNPGATGSYFGMLTNNLSSPWPGVTIPVSSWRSLGASVKWADLDTSPNSPPDFSRLDQWLGLAEQSGTDVMFTMYATPSWASLHGMNSSSPNTFCAFQQQNGPGICDPPDDLGCNGSGTDQHFKNFVSALINHLGPGKIKYWEMWNEPNIQKEWSGDVDCPSVPHAGVLMLARMAQDMREIVLAVDPNAKFTAPAATLDPEAATWLQEYLAYSNGANFADIMTFHGYVSTSCPGTTCPEMVADQIDRVNKVISGFPSAQGKPLFDTEGDWGPPGTVTDPDQQASYVARYYLMQMWKGVAKSYWWNWDISDEGAFYDDSSHSLNPAGNAYVQIVRWTNGGTAMVGPCSTDATVTTRWTCAVQSPGGAQAEAIWDTSQTCAAGNCSTSSVPVSAAFSSYLDLSGNQAPVANQSVPVGLKPIFLVQ